MQRRTFLLLVLVLVAAAALVLILVTQGIFGGDDETAEVAQPAEQAVSTAPRDAVEAAPRAEQEPAVRLEPVVIALTDLPVGERIRADLIRVAQRPEDNVAVATGITFSEPDLVVGQIVKTQISRGQEILRPMLALNPSDIVTLGSDLGLYIEEGRVAVAFPIDRFTGAAFGIRPGDRVDAFMSLDVVELDAEFQTIRPNIWQRVFEAALLRGDAFLFDSTSEGRLELIPGVNTVAVIAPGSGKRQIPRRISQLTVNQMEVLWVGSWRNPTQAMEQEFDADVIKGLEPGRVRGKERPEDNPDVVILSMTSQDALALKWAQETGIGIRLVLRAQGDNSVFVTTSVSLPQLVEQGTITLPEPFEFGLEPRVDEVPVPSLPAIPGG